MLSNENEMFGAGTGLKNRVTACRKRIRLHRFHRTQVHTQPGERLLESTSEASEFPGYLKEERKGRRPSINAPVIQDSSPAVAAQEVGIT
jgi:hypothetical protein